MAGIKVFEIAKEYGIDSREVISYLAENNIEVSSHMNVLDEKAAELVRNKYGKKAENAANAKAADARADASAPSSEKKTARPASAEGEKKPQTAREEGEKRERPKKKSNISAVFNPQNSSMGGSSRRRSSQGQYNAGSRQRQSRQGQERQGRNQGERNDRQDKSRQNNTKTNERQTQERVALRPARVNYERGNGDDPRQSFKERQTRIENERANLEREAKIAAENEKLAAEAALKKAEEEKAAQEAAAAAKKAEQEQAKEPVRENVYRNERLRAQEAAAQAEQSEKNAGERRSSDRQQTGRGDRQQKSGDDRQGRRNDRQGADRQQRSYDNRAERGSRSGYDRNSQGKSTDKASRGDGDRNVRNERKEGTGQKNYSNSRGTGTGYSNNRGYRQDSQSGQKESSQRGGSGYTRNAGRDQGKAPASELRGKENAHGSRKKKQGDYDKKNRHEEQFVNLEKKTGHKKRNMQPQTAAEKAAKEELRTIVLPEVMTVRELADKMKVQPSEIVKKLFMQGIMLTVNQEIDYEKAEEIALEFNCIAEPEEKVDVIAELLKEEDEDESLMITRPPVVCVMGHVDHGKTSLLDAIRKTHVTDREAGGITQHIGASVAEINGQKITFLDTPGHEAFTAMRMRGANATDIAVLVVAADDGIMPQTIEAINHARAAEVELIVAINKIDKPGANIDKVKQELSEQGLVPEDWGGSTICVPVSAHTGEGITDLLEMILLSAEVLELKANPDRKARGLVIEAKLDKGRGAVATVLVQKGTLNVGDPVAAGSSYGKVRAMVDDKGKRIKTAGASTPVEIIGLSSVPNAGEVFVVCDTEKDARSFAETFVSQDKERLLAETRSRLSLDDLFSQMQEGNLKELNIIVKADVQGSVEAVKQSLGKLTNEEVAVKVIHGAVGAINESDVILASASNAIIIGFNVKPDPMAKSTADQEKVDIRLYSVIYKAIEDIENAMKGMLDPIYEEKVIGHAIVRQIFKASGVGNIAGSYVIDGVLERNCLVRVSREGKLIHEGKLASLKRFKDDVKEVKTGFECGAVIEGFGDFLEDDVIEAYKMVEVPR